MQMEDESYRNVFKADPVRIGRIKALFFFGILDKVLRLHHSVELLDFCKGLEQANLLPSPPDLCDLGGKLVNYLHQNSILENRHGGNGFYLESLFDLFSLSLGVGLGLTVNLEPPHLLHQARHIIEKLLLARIVHLVETVYR